MNKIAIISLLLVHTVALGFNENKQMPDWANNSTNLSGSIYTTVCSGEGPEIDSARSIAINNCKVSASNFFKKETKINGFSVQTEKDSAFHEEVREEVSLVNLTCQPQKEQIYISNNSYIVWVLCKIDLSKVKELEIIDKKENKDVKVFEDNSTLNEKAINYNKLNTSTHQKRYVLIATSPKCDTILISGLYPDVVNCDTNPVKIIIKDENSKFTIRAKGYLPKTIDMADTNDAIIILKRGK